MSEQSVARILQDLNAAYSGGSEKTAGARSSAKKKKQKPMGRSTAGSRSKKAALEASLQTLAGAAAPGTKTASHEDHSAVAALEKMASELAQADYAATVKEAHTFGAAVFDGFLSRAHSYTGGGAGMYKSASEQHQEGVTRALADVAAYSEDCFTRGMQHATMLLRG